MADETADIVKDLKQQNELLKPRVKTLEEQLNQRIKALEDQLDQKVKVVDPKRELDSEACRTAKFKETTSQSSPSLFKVPDWVTSNKTGERSEDAFRWHLCSRLGLRDPATDNGHGCVWGHCNAQR